MELELIRPLAEMESMANAFIAEFKQCNEETINGSNGLMRYHNYMEWLAYIERVQKGLVAERVPSSTFFAVDKLSGDMVGTIDIRHRLSEEHYYGGHIGYSIRPSMRCKGYGSEILRLGIEKAKALNTERLLLTCKKTNTASKKVIEKNGGVLEKEIIDEGEVYLVYWIYI